MGFISWLETEGKKIEKDFAIAEPYVQGVGEAAVSAFLPGAAPAINSTINTIIATEQKYAALGKQTGTGAQKLQDVLGISGPVIANFLKQAGKPNDATSVTNVVNSLVTIMNLMPPTVVAPVESRQSC